MSFFDKIKSAVHWVRMNEPALATGLGVSGLDAVLEAWFSHETTWHVALPLGAAAVIRFLVYKPASVATVRLDDHTITQGPAV